MKKRTKRTVWAYVILTVFGLVMIYPVNLDVFCHV